MGDTTEKSSLSNYKQARVTDIEISYAADFETTVLSGSASYTVRILEENVGEVVLDTKDIDITGCSVAGAPVEFKLDEPKEPFGRALRIPITDVPAGSEVVVGVTWKTTASSTALQWLEPAQTSGSFPFLFSQSQAIHARSMLPCQDTPMVKATYTAHVVVPKPLVAVMSAQRLEAAANAPAAEEGQAVYSFRQKVPIPSYLISLAVGQLESRAVGSRTRVWAEPSVLEAAAWEFADMEQFVAAAEKLVGPYVWGPYEVLVCPRSYPYGGMEHPVVTNITPTLLAGDRSLVDVIAHECAHSWTGNLVTNATWESFFLNEGFTMMLERKICAAVFGPGAYDFDAASGAFALSESIRTFMDRGQAEFTKLVPDLTGIDPDDAFSSVPYEKGFALLHALQSSVGVSPFEAFLHDYIQTYKFKTVTAEQFRAYTIAYFGEGRFTLPRVSHTGVPPVHNGATGGVPSDEEIRALAVPNTGDLTVPPAGVSDEEAAAARTHGIDLSSFPWDAWFYAPGQCPMTNTFDRSGRDAVEALADAWVDKDVEAAVALGKATGTASWPASHWMAFLERLSTRSTELGAQSPPATFSPALLEALDGAYGFNNSGNSEIKLTWYTLSIRSGVEARVPDVLAFLRSVGRMKYVRPLFRELLKTTFGRPAALTLFETVKAAYHPICAKMVTSDIAVETGKPAVDPKSMVQVGAGAAAAVTVATASSIDGDNETEGEAPGELPGPEATPAHAVEMATEQPPEVALGEASRAGAITVPAVVPAPVPATEQAAQAESAEAGETEQAESGEDEEADEDDDEDEDDGESAPARKGFGVSVARAQAKAQAKARARLGRVRPAVAQPQQGEDEDEDGDEDDEEEEEQEQAGGAASAPGAASTPNRPTKPSTIMSPGLSSPAKSVAEAEARLKAAEARRIEMLAKSPLKPLSKAEREARDPSALAKAAKEARKAAAAGELIKEDDLSGGGGLLPGDLLGGAGTLVQESLESVQVSGGVASTLSTALAVVAVAAVAAGAVYVLGRRGGLRR